MPIPLLIPVAAALPKVFQGAKKLFSKGKNLFKGIKKKIGAVRKNKKNSIVDNALTNTPTKQTNNDNMNYDEQINDSGTDTQKAFLGLQSVNEGKKQQSKIIMIAGAVILVLFFFMKKK